MADAAKASPAATHCSRLSFITPAAAVLINLLLRSLELRQVPAHRFFRQPESLYTHPWLYFLPLDIGDGFRRWTTTGLIPLSFLEATLGPNAAFLLCNTALVVAGMGIAWWVARDRQFAMAIGWCLALTTQFHWAYRNGAVTVFYLGAIYLLWNLAAFARLIDTRTGVTSSRRRVIFILSLVCLVLWWEQWLDYWLFGVCVSTLLLRIARRSSRLDTTELRFARRVFTVTAVLYLAVKLPFAWEHVTVGKESEVILNYFLQDGLSFHQSLALAVEDVVTNAMTYTYLALTNYLPPILLPGQSLRAIPRGTLLSTQHGYHAPMQHLVYFHHVFLWYLAAGVAVTLFALLTVRAVAAAFRTGGEWPTLIAALTMLVWTGSLTHCLIKYRPYLSEPLLHYKALVSIIGVTVLACVCYVHVQRSLPPRHRSLFTACALLLLLSSALFRPSALSAMSQRLEMGTLPDPISSLADWTSKHLRPRRGGAF